MAQHFLLSTKGPDPLSLAQVLRLLGRQEAYDAFKAIRFADNGGEAFCPKCGSLELYNLPRRKMWRCKRLPLPVLSYVRDHLCRRKLSIRDILAAIAIFANGAKGMSALQLSRDLDVQYKTAFVMAHKLREAMAAEDKGAKVSGEVEIDGMYAGGYVKPANVKELSPGPPFAGEPIRQAPVRDRGPRAQRQDHYLCCQVRSRRCFSPA